jgi:hypothetical protein
MKGHGQRFDDRPDKRGHASRKLEETAHRQPNVLGHRSVLVEAIKAQASANVRRACAAYVAIATGNERITRNHVAWL